MIPENSDIVSMTAQADIHRLYIKVIQPTLSEFQSSNDDVTGNFDRLDEFLEAAKTSTHNALSHEVRRTFALVLAALFERYLRIWLSARLTGQAKEIQKATWPRIFDFVESVDLSIKADRVIDELKRFHLIANAGRHGNGPSAEELFQQMPRLWDHLQSKANVQGDLVGNMRIDDEICRDTSTPRSSFGAWRGHQIRACDRACFFHTFESDRFPIGFVISSCFA